MTLAGYLWLQKEAKDYIICTVLSPSLNLVSDFD